MNITAPPLERGKGWLEDDASIVAGELDSKHVSNLVGALAPAAANVLNYSSLLDSVTDQRNTSSCVGQAFATAMFLTAKIGGNPIPRPSAKWIYDLARMRAQPYIELVDDGSSPLTAVAGIAESGIVADAGEGGWPMLFHEGISNVNVRPPIDVYQSALGFTLGDYYRIAPGPGAASLVRHALVRGYCPVFAMPVDLPYERWNTDRIYEGRKESILGWHMQALCGFIDGALLIATSWGPTHGDAGVVAIADSYFDSYECKDIIVPTVIPRLVVQ